jgi:predicted GNAT superfamily acetyltransferase
MGEQMDQSPASPVRPVTAADHGWMHELNEQHAVELSSMPRRRFDELLGRAFYARVVEDQAAFMLAFDQGAAYDSPNFIWFRENLPRFVYVDRIVVSPRHRRRGLARILYQDLFDVVIARQQRHVVCEVNRDPPNPASDRFHAALGFTPMGEAVLDDRTKTVRYLRRDVLKPAGEPTAP